MMNEEAAADPPKPFCKTIDLSWALARIMFMVAHNSKPHGDQLVIVSPSDTDENGHTPASSVLVYGEANILALGELIDEWKTARAEAARPR